jgi:peptidoglycan/LPS O-acetylase OafA/YrhL
MPFESLFLLAGLGSAVARWMRIQQHDLSCAEFCYSDTSVLFLLGEPERTGDDHTPTLGSVFSLEPLKPGPTGCDACSMDMEAYSDYFSALYQQTEFRLAPFFVGAALASFQSKSGNMKRAPPSIVTLIAFFWALERHQVPGVSSILALKSFFPGAFLFAFGNYLDAIAWAVLLHATATIKSRWIKDFSSKQVFKLGSRLSFGVYMFHWPIMMDLIALIKRHGAFTQDTNPELACALLFLITSCSRVFSLWLLSTRKV